VVVNNPEIIKNQAKINDLLEKLRKKLRFFAVFNLEGQLVGRIKDFTLDKYRRLYMVIPQSERQADSPVYLLNSKYIQNIDISNRTVFVDLSLVELEQLPLYERSNNKVTQLARHSPTPPVTQQSISSSAERQILGEPQPQKPHLPASENLKEVGNESFTESEETSEVVEEQIVRLLEERLIVNRSKRKVGEIVVRKKIETRFVEVPVQREKLIIEQVGSESKQPVETERLSLEEFSGHSPTPSVTQAQDKTQSPKAPFFTTEDLQEVDEQSFTESDVSSEVAEEEIVRLLEERLVVNRSKWKVGEVVVRKEVETTTVQVPIQREKLIIEQVGSETKQLAEIDLAQGEVSGLELTDVPSSDTVERSVPSADNPYTVTGEFVSPKAVSNLLDAIALQGRHGCAKVRVELVLEHPELQETYQKMFDRCSSR